MKVVVTPKDIRDSKAHRTRAINSRKLVYGDGTWLHNAGPRVNYVATLHCPIARAMRRVIPNASIEVGGSSVTIIPDEGLDRNCELPQEARRFISMFDDGFVVVPIEFEVC